MSQAGRVASATACHCLIPQGHAMTKHLTKYVYEEAR
jgi:hypothetical protein